MAGSRAVGRAGLVAGLAATAMFLGGLGAVAWSLAPAGELVAARLPALAGLTLVLVGSVAALGTGPGEPTPARRLLASAFAVTFAVLAAAWFMATSSAPTVGPARAATVVLSVAYLAMAAAATVLLLRSLARGEAVASGARAAWRFAGLAWPMVAGLWAIT